MSLPRHVTSVQARDGKHVSFGLQCVFVCVCKLLNQLCVYVCVHVCTLVQLEGS